MLGRNAVFVQDRATLLNLRIRALRSKQCSVKENNYVCPEIFLDAVADKLASMAVLFLQVELVSEFYYQVTPASLTLSKNSFPESWILV